MNENDSFIPQASTIPLDNQMRLEELVPVESLRERQAELCEKYHAARPFPHLVVDDLFDADVLDRINEEFPDPNERDWLEWHSNKEQKTTSRGIDELPSFTRRFFLMLNSPEFIRCLGGITGMDELVEDPQYFGAGLQETFTGGWLNVHADWTRHRSLPLTRRLTLLLYLNRDWDPSWKGDIELWDAGNLTCAVTYAPVFNRLLLIPATRDALHGQPEKLACPSDRSRRFVSVNYWTADPVARQEARGIKWVDI